MVSLGLVFACLSANLTVVCKEQMSSLFVVGAKSQENSMDRAATQDSTQTVHLSSAGSVLLFRAL